MTAAAAQQVPDRQAGHSRGHRELGAKVGARAGAGARVSARQGSGHVRNGTGHPLDNSAGDVRLQLPGLK